jgi:tyrosine aminotransferase
MEVNGGAGATTWRISRPPVQGSPLADAGSMSIRAVLGRVFSSVDALGPRPVLMLGSGDPTACASFRPPPEAEDAIVDALRSGKHNGYSPTVGVLPARR